MFGLPVRELTGRIRTVTALICKFSLYNKNLRRAELQSLDFQQISGDGMFVCLHVSAVSAGHNFVMYSPWDRISSMTTWIQHSEIGYQAKFWDMAAAGLILASLLECRWTQEIWV